METKWLEDFISLAETHSFSRSAELRHVTQPAFSRRIKSLEAWLGADLIDRTSYPTRLTEAGIVFYEQAVEMLGQIATLNEELLRIWQMHRKSVLFVTHSIREAAFLSDRVLVMGRRPARIIAETRIGLPRPRRLEMTEGGAYNAHVRELRHAIEASHAA